MKLSLPCLIRKYKSLQRTVLDRVKAITNSIRLPGMGGMSLYGIGSFFVKGMLKGAIPMRASGVAFHLILSIFPVLIFITSLIPFVPVAGFQETLFAILQDLLPETAYDLFYNTIFDTVTHQRISVLSISACLMLFFASNGVLALINAFNNTYHDIETRNAINKRLISLLLLIILFVLFFAGVTLIILGNNFFFNILGLPRSNAVFYVVATCRWIAIILLFFIAISFLYYFAPARKEHFKFISPGSIVATVALIAAVSGFSFYVNHFARYNKLYGSLGTVIIIMLLFQIAAFVLIIGFELNASIKSCEKNCPKEKSKKTKAAVTNKFSNFVDK